MLFSGGAKDFLKSPEMFAKKPPGLIFVNNQKFCPVSPHFFFLNKSYFEALCSIRSLNTNIINENQ